MICYKHRKKTSYKEEWEMAKYDGVYSCGHEGTVNIIGPMKDREWKIERRFSGLCPECYKKKMEEERKKENEKALKLSKEMEFPDLTGTPKQVAWANTLRMKILSRFYEYVEDVKKEERYFEIDGEHVKAQKIIEDIEDVLVSKTEAKFWIDNRMESLSRYIKMAYDEVIANRNSVPEEVKEEMKDIEAALTVEPKEKEEDGIVSIENKDNNIYARYVKNERFIKIVKSLGYSWDGVWSKGIDEYSGPLKDRIAELGNKLLASGFTVRFTDEESMNMAISGEFTPECKKWVKYNSEKQKLAISWKGFNDYIYQEAKKISGSRWDNGRMLVPIEFYSEVLEFSEIMGFKISEKAKSKISDFKERADNFIKKEVKETVFEEKDGKKELRKQLKKSGIIEDLKDEA